MSDQTLTINGKTYALPDKKREAFTFFRNFMDAVEDDKDATDTQKLSFLLAILRYALDFTEPDQQTFSNMGRYAWKLVVPNITSGIVPFLNGTKGGKFGKLGGAPKGSCNNPNGRRGKEELTPKLTPNKNKNKNKNENENVTKKDKLFLNEKTTCSEEFGKFNEWLRTDCPHVCKLETQMDEAQFNSLLNLYDKTVVVDTLRKMENYKPLTKNNRDVYRTLRNWLTRDKAQKKGGEQ